jgi:hypothetical protein
MTSRIAVAWEAVEAEVCAVGSAASDWAAW